MTTQPPEALTTVVRTLRFEVVFPGSSRKADLTALWKELWTAQDDLRRAANRAISALYQVRLGTLPAPEKDGKPVPFRTLCYQALSGKWQPFGEPLYTPTTTRPVSSQVILDLAGTLYTRLQTDWLEIQRGQKSLPTFRSVPLGCTGPGVRVDRDTLEVSVSVWSGGKGRITLRPRKLDPSQRKALRTALKYGTARLLWHAPKGRKGRWMLSMSVEQPVTHDLTERSVVAAVRLGLHTTCTIAYAEDGKVKGRADFIDIPDSTWRQVERVEKERRNRGRWNRRDRGAREGRGRARKLRAVEGLGDKVARVTDTALRQVAAAVVAQAIRRGAGTLALPDLKGWSVARELDRTEDLPSTDRADRRRAYFRWHQGTLRQLIREAAEKAGLAVVDVDVARSSSTCSECGAYDPDARQAGRWKCPDCGLELPASVNTARVLVLRVL